MLTFSKNLSVKIPKKYEYLVFLTKSETIFYIFES